jgi:hypothetical protein
MANLTQHPEVLAQDTLSSSATQQHRLGTRAVTKDGRVFRYCLAGASDLVAGNCIQSAAILTNYLAMTPSAAAVTQPVVSVTPGATAAAAGLFSEGLMQIDTTPGNGYTYGILSHPAFAGSDLQAVTLYQDDLLQVALTTSSRVGMIENMYKGVIQFPVTTATGLLVGVAPTIIKASQYGWLQTWGLASVLINGTPALGAAVVSPSATTAGSVDVITTTNLVTAQIVGNMAQVGVSGKNNFCFLKIAA